MTYSDRSYCMKRYYGRKEELKLLNSFYDSDRFEFGYVYGQRRIGKTTLMQMLAEGKKSLFLFATDSEDLDNRLVFSRELNRLLGYSSGVYTDWSAFFESVNEYFGNEKGLLVIDEYPNLILTRDGKRKKTDFTSSLQKSIDMLFRKGKFTLILTGSNVSFMEKEIQDSKAPLYKRNTFQLLLNKFEFDEAVSALSDVKDLWEKAKFLALTNTFPYYLSLIDTSKNFNDNMNRLFFDRTAVFADDPSKVITSDVATGGLYASIIKAISEGYDTIKDLSLFFSEDSSKITKYVSQLVEDNVLIRRSSFHSKRDVHYEIFDQMMAFFYRFIRGNVEWIKSGAGKAIRKQYENAIKEFIEHAFEKECMTYLNFLNKKGRLQTFYQQFENLNINSKNLGRSIELDIVGTAGDNLLIGESKFSKQERTYQDYKDMCEDISVPPLSNYKNVEFYLFGANGFDNSLRKVADHRLHLIDLKTMFDTSK